MVGGCGFAGRFLLAGRFCCALSASLRSAALPKGEPLAAAPLHRCARRARLPLPLGEVPEGRRGLLRIRREVGGCGKVLPQLPPPSAPPSCEGGIGWGGFADSPGGFRFRKGSTAGRVMTRPYKRQPTSVRIRRRFLLAGRLYCNSLRLRHLPLVREALAGEVLRIRRGVSVVERFYRRLGHDTAPPHIWGYRVPISGDTHQ